MIATLSGRLEHKFSDSVVLVNGGIGYEVFVSAGDVAGLQVGQDAQMYIYEHIREDQHTLYGFSEMAGKQFFVRLISVSGVGPKVAMQILSAAGLTQLSEAVSSGNAELFRSVAGVGQKTAQRIIVELRGKLESATSAEDSAYQALLRLGYSATEATKAVAAIPADIVDEQARIKAALAQAATK